MSAVPWKSQALQSYSARPAGNRDGTFSAIATHLGAGCQGTLARQLLKVVPCPVKRQLFLRCCRSHLSPIGSYSIGVRAVGEGGLSLLVLSRPGSS